MNEHMKITELSTYCKMTTEWLNSRYGELQGKEIWDLTCKQYDEYLKDLPYYGGKKNQHAEAIYGGLIIFSLYPLLPDNPPIEELQDFVQDMFMGPMVKLGKFVNLNRKWCMKLLNFIFAKNTKSDQEQYKKYPATFCNIGEPYDEENQAARYCFTQCPNAEFAKKHNLLNVLPLLCNSDYYGIEGINGTLIRLGTCATSDKCDYCVVGSKNPLAAQYEIVKDENGFLVSRKRN